MVKRCLRGTAAIVFAGAMLGVSPELMAGPAYQNPAGGYSLTLPDGWAPLDQDTLKKLAASLSADPSVPMTLDAGYAPGGDIGPSVEFLLITSLPNLNGKQLDEKGMDQYMQGVISGATKSNVRGAALESSKLDKNAKNFQARFVIPTNGVKVHESLFGFFGRKRVIQVIGYSSDSAFPEAGAKYGQVAQSFHYDPDFAYDDGDKYYQLGRTIGYVLMALVAVVFAVFVAIRASRRRPPAAPFAGYTGFPQQPAPPQGWLSPAAPSPPQSTAPPPFPGGQGTPR